MGRLGDHLIDYTSNNGGTSAAHTKSHQCTRMNGTMYECHTGYCCEDTCCPYYYELWWFWVIWLLAIVMSCCCAYHHKRKSRQNRLIQAQAAFEGMDAYAGACNYPGPPVDHNVMGYAKLPIYDDVIRIPPTSTPPPPYTSRRNPISRIAYVQSNENGESAFQIIPCNITASMLSLASLSYYIPGILSRASVALGRNDGEDRSSRASSVLRLHIDSRAESTITIHRSSPSDNNYSSAYDVTERQGSVVTSYHGDDERQSMAEGCSRDVNNNSNDDEAKRDNVIIVSDVDSDDDDAWMDEDNADPNNNDVAMMRKLSRGDVDYGSNDDSMLLPPPPKSDVSSPMASIQDLMEAPRSYDDLQRALLAASSQHHGGGGDATHHVTNGSEP